MGLRIGAACAALLLQCAPAQAAPVDAIRAGDMEQMIEEIIAIYEDAGLSWLHGIEWTIGPYTTTYWVYRWPDEEIIVGAVPEDDEVETYWQTWSDVLTDGNFEPGSFFASPEEARELAHYNQYVLATHESAHAMSYRYDTEHLGRHDYAVNCREYYADRLTIAILNELAIGDADMTRWRQRYLELVTAMGDTIPEQYRYHIADFATLDADCAVIDVAQPTPDTMQPYASAYFERYRVLLEAELPPLREVFDTHLRSYHEAVLERLPLDADRARYELATLGSPIARSYPGDGRDGEATSYSRAAAFGPDGTLYFAIVRYDSETRRIAVEFGTDPVANPVVAEEEGWPRPSARLEVTSLAVLSPDSFAVALQQRQVIDADKGDMLDLADWLYFERRAEGWVFAGLGFEENVQTAAVLRDPEGRLYVMASPDVDSVSRPSPSWWGVEIDRGTLTPKGDLVIDAEMTLPFAIDREQRLYEARGDFTLRHTAGEGVTVLAGIDLQGTRDGMLDIAEQVSPEALQWMADGTARVLDTTSDYAAWIVRELRPVPPAP